MTAGADGPGSDPSGVGYPSWFLWFFPSGSGPGAPETVVPGCNTQSFHRLHQGCPDTQGCEEGSSSGALFRFGSKQEHHYFRFLRPSRAL